jgi:hypothetical protein
MTQITAVLAHLGKKKIKIRNKRVLHDLVKFVSKFCTAALKNVLRFNFRGVDCFFKKDSGGDILNSIRLQQENCINSNRWR